MKDKDKLYEQKRKLSSLISKNLIVMSVAIVVALTGIIAWFTHSQTVTADGIDVTCELPDGLEVAVVAPGQEPTEADYKKGEDGIINLNKTDYTFLNDLEFVEITSNGAEFIKPALIQNNGSAYPDTSASAVWTDAIPNQEYLSFDVYMRMKSSSAVYLDGDTIIKPVSEELTGADAGNKSDAGAFSRDCIVGAARMSVTNGETTDKTPNILWIPAPHILYDANNKAMSVSETSGESYEHSYYSSDRVLETADAIANTGGHYKIGKSEGHNRKFADLTKASDSNYYVAHRRVNVWIEGQDKEARFDLIHGKYKMQLKLTLNQ